MIGINYNKKFNIYEIWSINFCECGNHTKKDLFYSGSLENCLSKIKKDVKYHVDTQFHGKARLEE